MGSLTPLVYQVIEVGPDRLGVLGIRDVLHAGSRVPGPLTSPVREEHGDALALADVQLTVEVAHLLGLEVEHAVRDQRPTRQHCLADNRQAHPPNALFDDLVVLVGDSALRIAGGVPLGAETDETGGGHLAVVDDDLSLRPGGIGSNGDEERRREHPWQESRARS